MPVQPVAATPQKEFEIVPYCMKRINEPGSAAGLCELIDKMLIYPKLIEDEQRFEEVCQFVSAVNRSRRDDANLNWTREDWQQVVDRLAYRMTAADMQREAMNPTNPAPTEAAPAVENPPFDVTPVAEPQPAGNWLGVIESLTKPGDLLGHLTAAMTAGCSVPELLTILERAAKHAEAMLQGGKWTESVVDSVQDKVKEYFGQVSPQPTHKELVP